MKCIRGKQRGDGNTMNKIRKGILAIALVMGLSLVAPAVMPVAGNVQTVEAASNKANIKKTVKNFFKYAKTMNIKKMKNYVTSDCKEKIDDLNTTPALKAFMKKRNKSLTYSIKKVKVSGKTATVKVKCKYLNSNSAYVKMLDDLFTWLFTEGINNTDYSTYTEEEQQQLVDNVIKKSFANNAKAYEKKYKTKTFTIKLKKVSGKWKISQVDKNLLDAITSNYQSAGEKYFETWTNQTPTNY